MDRQEHCIKTFTILNNTTEIKLDNTGVPIKKGQSRETGNIGYIRRRKTKQKYNTISFGHHYAQTSTNNVYKTCTLLQTTGGKDKPNIVFMRTS